MPNSSSNFYSLKRSALLFLSVSALLMLSIVDENSSILGISLSVGSLKVFSALVYGAALFYAASYFLTAYIDVRKVYLDPADQLIANRKTLESLASDLRSTVQKLPIRREEIELPTISEIVEALKTAPNAKELLRRWDERSLWSHTEPQFNDNISHRVGRLIGGAISDSVALSSDAARAHDAEISAAIKKSATAYFDKNAWPPLISDIKAELAKQSDETRSYFDSLAREVENRIENKVDNLTLAIEQHADNVRPLMDEISPQMGQLAALLDDISHAIAAVKVRFWLFDIAPVATLTLFTFVHFIGLAIPLLPSAGQILNPSHLQCTCADTASERDAT